MNTHKRFACIVKIDGIHRAGFGTIAAADAQLFLDNDTAAFAVAKSPGWANVCTGCRFAGQAGFRLESGRKAAGGDDANSGRQPAEFFVQ
jgi:hypothetical protein